MNDHDLLRYSRHILLPEIDIAGQQNICDSTALVVGLGGLGSPVAMYLAASGVGKLILIDDDVVDESNLSRQILHREKQLQTNKTESAKISLLDINSRVKVDVIDDRLGKNDLVQLLSSVDVAIECTDNLTSRCALNKACMETKTPLVSGAAIRFEGQLTVFDFRTDDSPCYQCLYDLQSDEELSCSQSGIFSPVVGVVGTSQALEALKMLAGLQSQLIGRLGIFNGIKNEWRYFGLKRDANCRCCGESA